MIQELSIAFNSGGPFMWVILIVFAAACAVVIERMIFYFLICKPDGVALVTKIAGAVNDKHEQQAIDLASRRKAPTNILLRTALERFIAGMPFNDIQKGVDGASIREIPRMTQRLNYLSLFANIATLLGLLGTIVGLQEMFGSLATVAAEKKAAMLASGIAQAMNTTAFGLIVAVPCMVMSTFLHNRQQTIVKDLDEAVVNMLDFIEVKSKSEGGLLP